MTVTEAGAFGSKQAKHVNKRRRSGLCGREGCDNVSGDNYRCPEHARAHAALMKARRAAAKASQAEAAA